MDDLKKKVDDLAANTRLSAALKGNFATGAIVDAGTTSRPTAEPTRTVATPDWEGDSPPFFETRVNFEAIPIGTFNADYSSLRM